MCRIIQVSIDSDLVASEAMHRDAAEVILMPNGCVCCRVRGDLVEALKRIATHLEGVDGVIIECSGLAECAPVAQTFFLDDFVQSTLQLDAIVCVCDCPRLERLLLLQEEEGGDESKGEAEQQQEEPEVSEEERKQLIVIAEQLAMADVVLLNKATRVTHEIATSLQQYVASINASAPSLMVRRDEETHRLELDVSRIIGINAFSLEETCAINAHFMPAEGEAAPKHQHKHDSLGFR